MKISIKVKSNSKKQEITKQGDVYVVKLKERAEKNKANLELIKLLSKHFNISSNNIKITKGLTSKQKIIELS